MKYVGAYSIAGYVTRLVPQRTEEKENKLYYEFLDFYQVSFNCDVWFSREGSYKKLLKLMGKEPEVVWSAEERALFKSAYSRFSKAFTHVGGDKLNLTCSDAFLIYVRIFEYDKVKGQTEMEMAKGLDKTWKEIELAAGGNQVELVENPEQVEFPPHKPSLFNWLKPVETIEPEMLKIAFIYNKTAKTSGWSYAHELGRMHLEQIYGGRLKTMALDNAGTELEIENAVEQAVAAGCNMIFTTGPQMANQSVRSAIQHPEVRFYNCSIKMSYSSIYTYYGRMYEAKFLLGAIAAAMTKSDRLGYVADYPIYGTLANINAFAMGARMINPYVKVCLEWSRTRESNPALKLKEAGITYISGEEMITPDKASREYGLYVKREDGTLENLAAPIWHWGKFYERIVKSVCLGGGELSSLKGKKAVNYWWGMSAEVVDVIYSQNLPHGIHRLIDFLKNSIRAGSFHPFDGLIYSQNGKVQCQDGEALTAEEIISMDWLAENVVGEIPEFTQLTQEAQTLVRLQGVKADAAGGREE